MVKATEIAYDPLFLRGEGVRLPNMALFRSKWMVSYHSFSGSLLDEYVLYPRLGRQSLDGGILGKHP